MKINAMSIRFGGPVLRSSLPELIFWVSALLALALSDPAQSHYTLCPLARAGITWCPGCGLGHGITFALQGHWAAALHSHPLALFAPAVIFHRIIQLTLKIKPIQL